jgi:ubiquinone/menaquinone biosynthesis C-methylase UbiE
VHARIPRAAPGSGAVCPPQARAAVSLLDVRADDRVLEIGAGAGLAMEELARLAAEGYVCGIDHSELMLRRAKRHKAEGLGRGVVDLRLGSVEDLPAFDEPFDKILAVTR